MKGMKKLKFNKKEVFENNIKFCCFSLIDINCFNNDYSQNYMKYCTFNNKIHFFLDNNQIISFKSNNNIISLNEIINDSIHLKQLIKIFYFRKYINEIIKSNRIINCKNDIYLINRNILNTYKDFFNYKELNDFLKGNPITQSIDYKDLESDYFKIISELDDNYINQIAQKKTFPDFKDIDGFREYKINSPLKNDLKYIINFEIVDKNIKNFFINNKIAKEEHFLPCSYISENGKILIIFNKDNKIFYEIGHFNDNEDFIIELLIDELEKVNKQNIFDYFLKYGIAFFIKISVNKPEKIINLDHLFEKILYFKIDEGQINKKLINQINNDNINNYNDNFKNNQFIKDIFYILLSIFKLEKKLMNSNKDNNQNSLLLENIILLSSTFANDFKNLILLYDKIYNFLKALNIKQDYNFEEVLANFSKYEEGKHYFELILNSEKVIKKYKDNNEEYFFFEKKSFTTNSQEKFFYPDKFYIIDKNIFSKIMEILKKDIKMEISFDLYYNFGKIALKPKINGIFDNFNDNFFIFLYSLSKGIYSFEINYIPEIILSFDDISKRFNFFNENTKNNNNIFEISSDNNVIEKYKFKSYLINENKIKGTIKDQIKKYDLNNRVNKFLSYLIIIYNENNKIKKEIKETIFQSNSLEKQYYLINRKYMDELENILYFKEFTNNINIYKIKNLDLDINYIQDNCKEYINNYLIKIDENKLKFENIYNNLSKKELSDNENNKLYYYDGCQIINQKLYNFLNHIDKNIQVKAKLINAIIKDIKIFFFLNEKIINTGYLYEENNTLIIENVIYSESSQELLNISEIFKAKGYSYMEAHLLDKFNKNIIVNSNSLYINLYTLSGSKEANKNTKNLSSKLKTLILLSLFEQKKTDYYKMKKSEKVFLMNKNWLFQYQYQKINSLIEEDEKIKNYLGKQNQLDLSIDSHQMNDIISLLDYEELLKIDEYISNFRTDCVPNEAKNEKLKLKDIKTIIIYNNFVMINDEFCQIFNRYFSKTFYCNNISYASHINGDIIIINDFGIQNSILFGKLNHKDFSFDIKFIFDFKYNYCLENESKNLMNKEIKEYIKEKIIFNDNNIENNLSPIYENDEIIGYCYKYSSDLNNEYNDDCFNYLSNDNLSKAIKLYFFYREFSVKIKENQYDKKEYYLINDNLMSEIKINYKYKQIKEKLDTIEFMNKNKKDILAIKSLPNDIIKYFKENDIKNKYEKEFIEPNIIPIKDINSKKDFMIYDKFEILSKEMVQILIDEGYGSLNNPLECEINEGKIIINYPSYFNNNDKYILVIGYLNYENQFINEYILFYNDYSAVFNHMYEIKGNLKGYLSSLQLYENSSPIIDRNYKEIGTIIKYNSETSNYNLNNLIMKEKEIEINNDIINKSNKGIFNDEPQDSANKINENNIIINQNIDYNKSYNYEHEDEYNLDYQTNSYEIRSNFPFPPKIGLQNIGATCYMNATLQCFCHIEKFVNFFKYSQQVITIVKNDKSNLTSSFKLLIEKLWPNNYDESNPQKYYSPDEFKNKISKMNPLFEGIAANDAKDLVNFIIMTLHQELNKAKKVNTPRNIILDQSNPQIMFNNFASNFINENQSIISDLFYGINCNMTQCYNCKSNIYNYQIYFFLVFPLEEVRKFKNNNQMNFINQPVNIYDCFDYDRKINYMYGENAMYCNSCKQNANCQMCTTLTTGPEILILLLNRGNGIEFNVKIIFPEELNLFNYIEYKNTGCIYKLIGVITHIGESGMGGHFIAYCKDPISQTWYKYNDAIVSEVQDFQNEVINFAMPYLLFYQKN